jgi:hypothetical protein
MFFFFQTEMGVLTKSARRGKEARWGRIKHIIALVVGKRLHPTLSRIAANPTNFGKKPPCALHLFFGCKRRLTCVARPGTCFFYPTLKCSCAISYHLSPVFGYTFSIDEGHTKSGVPRLSTLTLLSDRLFTSAWYTKGAIVFSDL